MATQSLAIKYRPKTWEDVVGQESTKIILSQQLKSGEIRHAYLFCGPAGCGKTTCARIFANEVNHNSGTPIELDAASHNGIDDVRELIQQAKTKSLNSEYKVFIVDECHALSNSAWQAMLKIIEEPPAKSIFIFCTTDPQKIPKTIISRVQRYDFKRVSTASIVERLLYVLDMEDSDMTWTEDVLYYIANLADGGMRDALTLLDKCIAMTSHLSMESVIKALGTADYDTMFELIGYICNGKSLEAIELVENLYAEGKDIKLFVKQFLQFLLDVMKYSLGVPLSRTMIPTLEKFKNNLFALSDADIETLYTTMEDMMKLNAEIKYSSVPKYDLEAVLLIEIGR